MEKEQNSLLFDRKSDLGLLVSLSLPAVVLMVIMTVYNMTDTYFIGKLGNTSMLAAVSLCSPIMGIQSALGTLFGDGASSLVARALGAKNGKEKSAAGWALLLSAGIGALLGLAIYFLAPVILPFLGGTENTIPYALDYLRILAVSAPFGVFTTAFANIVRSTGAVKEGMMAHLSGTVSNMILDPVFILLLGMGVKGAALATAIGNILAGLILIFTLLKKSGSINLHPKTIIPAALSSRSILPQILALGLPSAAGNLLMNFSSALQNRFLSGFGDEAIAAFSIGGKAGMLICMVTMGICVGMQPAFGYFYGAGEKKRLRGCLTKTLVTASVLSFCMMAVMFCFDTEFVSMFTSEAALQALSLKILHTSILSAPIIGFYYLSSSYLQASGQAVRALITSVLRQGMVMIPAILILSNLFGLSGIIWCGFVTDLVSTVAAVFIVLSKKISIQSSHHSQKQTC